MGQISQISSFTSYLGQRNCIKIGPVWKCQIYYPSVLPKTKIGPQGPDEAPEWQKKALIILVQSNNDH